MDVRVFSRRGVDKDERAMAIERAEIERLALFCFHRQPFQKIEAACKFLVDFLER